MSEQREMTDIQEGLAKIFWDLTMGSYDMAGMSMVEQAEYKADIILTYLRENGVVRKVEGELPPLTELSPDVDACFGQQVCCDILPKYLPDATMADKCYREIISLAYDLAYTIAGIQQKYNKEAGYTLTASLLQKESHCGHSPQT